MAASADTVHWLLTDRAHSYIALATATCVLYDHVCTLDDEMELVWKRPKWTPIQFLFLINRYGADVVQITAAFIFIRHITASTVAVCTFITEFTGYIGILITCSMQCIMACRVSSMYMHQRKIIVVLCVAFLLEITSMVVIQVLISRVYTPIPEPADGVFLCKQNSFPSWSYTFWIPLLCFELLIFLLSIWLALKFHKTNQLIREIRTPSPIHSLLFVLLRDSILFPFIGVCGSAVIVFVWMRLSNLPMQIASTLFLFVPSILGCRLILNLREAYYRPFQEECDITLPRTL